MLVVELIGGQLVVRDVEEFGKAVREGSLQGVRMAAEEFADDLRQHTPRKSGRAQESVIIKESQAGKVQTVRYDFKKSRAFYMRFVLLGAKPHTINLKLMTARRRANALKKKYGELRAVGVAAPLAHDEAMQFTASLTRKLALTFTTSDGKQVFAKSTNHPGIKGSLAISLRMAATQEHLARVIAAEMERAATTAAIHAHYGDRLKPVGGNGGK